MQPTHVAGRMGCITPFEVDLTLDMVLGFFDLTELCMLKPVCRRFNTFINWKLKQPLLAGSGDWTGETLGYCLGKLRSVITAMNTLVFIKNGSSTEYIGDPGRLRDYMRLGMQCDSVAVVRPLMRFCMQERALFHIEPFRVVLSPRIAEWCKTAAVRDIDPDGKYTTISKKAIRTPHLFQTTSFGECRVIKSMSAVFNVLNLEHPGPRSEWHRYWWFKFDDEECSCKAPKKVARTVLYPHAV